MTSDLLADFLRTLDEAGSTAARREILGSHPDPDALLPLLLRETQRMGRVEPRRAAFLGRMACLLAVRIGTRAACSSAQRALAQVLIRGGRPQPALRALERAAAGQDEVTKARMAPEFINCLADLGRIEEAEAHAAAARAVHTTHGDAARLVLLAIAESNLLERLERFQEARERLETVQSQLHDVQVSPAVARVVRGNLANILTQLSEYDQADALHIGVEAQEAAQGRTLEALRSAYNRAYVTALRGRFGDALARLTELEPRFRDLGDERLVGLCALDRAEIELRLGRAEEAAESASAAERLLLRLGHRRDAARAQFFQGMALLGRGAAERAAEVLASATGRLDAENSPSWAAVSGFHHAAALRAAGHVRPALRHARHAAHVLYRIGLVERGGHAELLEAALERDLGRPEVAEKRLLGLLARLGETHAPWLRCDVHHELARCVAARGDVKGAWPHALRALELLETHRLGAPPDEYMASFLDRRAGLAETAVRLLARAAPAAPERLFGVIEGAKGRALLDMLRAGRHRAARRETEAEARLEEVEREIEGLGTFRLTDEPARAAAEAARRSAALVVRQERLRASLDRLAADEDGRTQWHQAPLHLDAVRSALGADTTLLQYYVGADQLVIVVVGPDGLHVVERPIGRREVRRLLRRLAFQFDRPAVVFEAYGDRLGDLTARADRLLHEAWDLLLAPVADRVPTQRLVIVPHGVLHGLPFHALGPAGGTPLFVERDVVTAPSASVFVHCASHDPCRRHGVSVFGVPDADAPRLGDEALRVAAAHADSDLFVGAQATRDRVVEALGRARLVHLASHGTFDDQDPLLSGVRLGDGWLRTADLYGSQIGADLIVLSGCVTGRSGVRAADEPMGLVRGFLCAGARTLVNTLWHVADAPTTQAMAVFHGALAAGRPAAAALRQATLAVREQHPHPAHWAPFSLVGALG